MYVYYYQWGFGGKVELRHGLDLVFINFPIASMCHMMIPGTYAQMHEDYS